MRIQPPQRDAQVTAITLEVRPGERVGAPRQRRRDRIGILQRIPAPTHDARVQALPITIVDGRADVRRICGEIRKGNEKAFVSAGRWVPARSEVTPVRYSRLALGGGKDRLIARLAIQRASVRSLVPIVALLAGSDDPIATKFRYRIVRRSGGPIPPATTCARRSAAGLPLRRKRVVTQLRRRLPRHPCRHRRYASRTRDPASLQVTSARAAVRPGRGGFRPVYVGMNSVGRAPSQRISLDFGDESISREEHAFITYDDETRTFYLQHGGKSNLVRLGGAPVLQPTVLKPNDLFRIGNTTFRFVACCGPDFNWSDEVADA